MRGRNGRRFSGEDDGYEQLVDQDSSENVASREQKLPERLVDPLVGREEYGQ